MKKILIASLILVSSVAFANPKQIHVAVKGMVCESCAKKISTKLQSQDGVQKVKVNLKKGIVDLTMKDGKDLSDDQIKTIVNDSDYSVATITRQ